MLTLSPRRGRMRLYFQTYPDAYVDAELYAQFLKSALWHIKTPLVVVHDGGTIHKGQTVHELEQSCDRLHLHLLPPYAPELNPVEYVWTYAKSHRLANHAPQDVSDIDRLVVRELEETDHDQHRLRSFFASAPLSWENTTLFI